MAKFMVVLERTDTVTKQAEIMIEAESAEQARQFIVADLQVDPGCYDDDLRAVEDGVGEMLVKVESQDARITHFPKTVAGRGH
jgi:hypothetical protein